MTGPRRRGHHPLRTGREPLTHEAAALRVGSSSGLVLIVVVIAALAAVNAMVHFGPAGSGLFLAPAAALLLIALGRRAGLSWEDLGLARRSWGRGMRYGAVAVALVAAVYLIGAVLPPTRGAFLDSRYHLPAGRAVLTALVVIPVRTVLLEEVAFRGVLTGLLRRHVGTVPATGISSVLFGLWHVLPSLGLSSANHAVGSALGRGASSQLLVVAGAVAFTGLSGVVFCELRRRSGSLLASAGLHWATNGLGVALAAILWTLRPL